MVLLVRGTVSAVLEQSGGQMGRIAEGALASRAQVLNDVAIVLGVLKGDLTKRNRSWSHPPISTAAIVSRKTGRVIAALGPAMNAADLKALVAAKPDGPPLIRTENGLVIAGTSIEEKTGNLVVAGQDLGEKFAAELKNLLQTDIDVKVAGRMVAATRPAPGGGEETEPLSREFLTPGGAKVEIVMHMPVTEVRTARRSALIFTIGGGVLLLLLALVFYGYSLVRVTRPIQDLIQAAERMATGDLEARLKADAPAELGALVEQFNKMPRALKEAQEKRVHAAKLSSVGQMVAGISHELNNPLQGLLSSTEHLQTKFPENNPIRGKLDTVMQEGQRMRRILADLRGFTRPSGHDRAIVDLNRIVRDVAALVRHDAEKAKIRIETSLDEEKLEITASADQIRQVALNLFLNAIQAMPEGGQLRASTARGSRDGKATASVTVADTGTGIPADVRRRVCEPFFTTKPGRMGLGLSICQEMISQHQGTLTIDSKSGEGTRVTLELPEKPPA